MFRFFEICEMLPVLLPVEIKCSHKNNPDAVAYYEPLFGKAGNLKRHKITIYLPELKRDKRDFETLIAHELIHAWQEEKGHSEIHGKRFAKMAIKLNAHFGLRGIYDPEIDSP